MIRGLNPDKRRKFSVLQKAADRLSVPSMDTAIVPGSRAAGDIQLTTPILQVPKISMSGIYFDSPHAPPWNEQGLL